MIVAPAGKGSGPSTEASVGTFVVADVVPGWGRPSNDVRLDDPDVGSAGQRRGWKPPPLRKSRLRLSNNWLRLRQCGNLSRSRRRLRIESERHLYLRAAPVIANLDYSRGSPLRRHYGNADSVALGLKSHARSTHFLLIVSDHVCRGRQCGIAAFRGSCRLRLGLRKGREPLRHGGRRRPRHHRASGLSTD